MKWIPKILSLICLWGSLAVMVTWVEPELIKDVGIRGMYLPFLVLLTLAMWYTLSIVVRSMYGGMILSLTIVGGVALSILRLMHVGLAAVILLTLVMESVYIYRRYEKVHPTNEQKDRGASL